jgi:TetR/AcrR family transcriptional regulator of autoinduction and epiphytic fitness
VDELAERADVARRTVFDHFAPVDDVLLAVCAETLAVVVDDFLDSVSRMRGSDGGRASMFDELAAGSPSACWSTRSSCGCCSSPP